MERFGRDYDCWWYTAEDRRIYEYDATSHTLRTPSATDPTAKPTSLTGTVLAFCRDRHKGKKFVVVSYPYFTRSLWLAVLLFLLRPFRLKVVVDVQDLALPREPPWTASYLVWWVVDQLYYRHASFIVNAAECERLYAGRTRGAIFLIPMAAHADIITPSRHRRERRPLTLGYVGTIAKARGFPELIHVIGRLRAEGLDVDLIVNGNNPENIDLGSHPWVRRYEKGALEGLAKLLQEVDIGLIPYVDAPYWGLMSLTKMATYMAAGLPILSFQLTETSKILDKWECGISVPDWEGLAAAIRHLHQNPLLIDRLGVSARKAAVQEYNWSRQAERFDEFLHQLAQ